MQLNEALDLRGEARNASTLVVTDAGGHLAVYAVDADGAKIRRYPDADQIATRDDVAWFLGLTTNLDNTQALDPDACVEGGVELTQAGGER